jgi:Ca2+-binding EF-hand superfamily protein
MLDQVAGVAAEQGGDRRNSFTTSSELRSLTRLLELLYAQREHLDSLFRFFDTDGNGAVNNEECEDAMYVMMSVLDSSLDVPRHLVRDFVLSLDKDSDGNINYNEFYSIFESLDKTYSESIDSVSAGDGAHKIPANTAD